MDEESFVYGVRKQSKCISHVPGNSDRNYFLIGTVGVSNDNEIHLIDFDEDQMGITSTIFPHPQELVELIPSPTDSQKLITLSKKNNQSMNVSFMKMNVELGGQLRKKQGQLELITTLDQSTLSSPVRQLSWNSEQAVLVTGDSLYQLTIEDNFKLTKSYKIPAFIKKCKINPHHSNEVGYIYGGTVEGYDFKSGKKTYSIEKAHMDGILDLDYNPNKLNQIVTSGRDGKIRIWDLRHPEEPVMEISNHSHWITCVSYNQFHDQLLLSSGTDTLVNIHSIVSVSSTPKKPISEYDDADSDSENSDDYPHDNYPTDGVVATFDQHEDSVYQVAWSAADPWIFASLSFDGRVLVNFVPREHKYKIIL